MKWKLKDEITNKVIDTSYHPSINQLLLQRGLINSEEIESFLFPDFERGLHDPFLFKDMNLVVDRVKEAIKNNEIIGIFGDHDADGISSATILSEGLESLGLHVEVYIPDKMTEGHGINISAIDIFREIGVTLMFSVDCGTTNIEEVDYAKSQGIDAIITDHHHAPENLPNALAIINPQTKGEKYPFKELSGTAVAFKILQALYSKISPEKTNQLKWLLDVVCVGTVADCMPLVGENRILVKYGLLVLSKTRRLGYKELISEGSIPIKNNKMPSAQLIAFQVAPRINAAGRMSHAKHAYELMREESIDEAKKKAKNIEQQNIERRKLVEKITREVEKTIKTTMQDDAFIVVASEKYPVGIVGIVAGRIAEKYQKPTGVFTKFESESRGSFRTAKDIHILEVLNACSEHLLKHGGHEKAAGATLDNNDLEKFIKKANAHTKKISNGKKHEIIRWADVRIDLGSVNHETLDILQKFEPFGESNSEPIFFIENITIESVRFVGNGERHMKFIFTDNQGIFVDGIGFGLGKKHGELSEGDQVSIYAYIQENEWMGNVNVQLNIVDIAV